MTSAPAVDTTYQEAFAVGAGSDSVTYAPPLRALWVGTATAGVVTVVTAAGQTVVFNNVAAGSLIPIQCSAVKATGTSNASNIVGLR